jgi:hypothetical protein
MLRSTATGVMLALCAAAAGVIVGEERLAAQRPESSGSEQPSSFHQKFAPASRVNEPYQRLFQPNKLNETLPQAMHVEAPPRAHSSKRVVCGLTMIAVDPKGDPKMLRPLQSEANGKQPAGSAPEPKVRRIEPTVCRD